MSGADWLLFVADRMCCVVLAIRASVCLWWLCYLKYDFSVHWSDQRQ